MDKIILKGFIIKAKFLIRKRYKILETYHEHIDKYNNLIKFNEEMIEGFNSNKAKICEIEMLKEIKNIEEENEELKNYINKLKEASKEHTQEIHKFGNIILDIQTYIDNNFSLQEKIYLISGNTESCNEIIKYYKKHDKNEPMFLDLIMQHGEYQNNRQREKDWIDCPKYEMPLFNAIQNPMIERMNNSGVSIFDSPLFEQTPYYTMDSNGNLKKNDPEVIREEGNLTVVRF